jgi:hypothetical protein
MTVRILRVMWLLGSLLAFTVAVSAQSQVVTVHVPFAFEAGGKLLPAGDYRVDKAEGPNLLLIRGGPGNSAAFLTMAVESGAQTDGASLIFARQGARLVLSAIRSPGQEARVVLGPHAAMKAGVVSSR